jgi:hypothetical protein
MQKTASSETPGESTSQFQIIKAFDRTRNQQTIKVEYMGKVMEISLAEMGFYCDLFEEMFDELDRREPSGVRGFEELLDEFDRAEIEHLRLRYGTMASF